MLTLSQAYRNMKRSQTIEGFKGDLATGTAVTAFLVLFVIQIVFAFFAIAALVKCSDLGKIPPWATIVIAVLFFVPDLGLLAAIGVIAYYFSTCR